MEQSKRKAVRLLNPEVARKIAAGEVIDRPNAIVRELLDNAVDSGASRIKVEITSGGIEKIRVIDNGSGMTKEDLMNCARPHATSKISSEEDLLHLSTLGFRGEALSSMAAVSRLEIKSNGWKMNASVTEDHLLTEDAISEGTIVQTTALFENFPARRVFLKRPASEGLLCRNTFEEKALPRPDIAFTLTIDGEEKLNLPKTDSLVKRFTQTMNFFEEESLFYEIGGKAPDGKWSFQLVIGEPGVSRSTRKEIYIFVNGRKISEYSLLQAIEYGAQGYFPNGTHPVACLFVTMDSSLVDFNIHPAKKEARFKDISELHHEVSTVTRNFFKDYTVKNILINEKESSDENSVNQTEVLNKEWFTANSYSNPETANNLKQEVNKTGDSTKALEESFNESKSFSPLSSANPFSSSSDISSTHKETRYADIRHPNLGATSTFASKAWESKTEGRSSFFGKKISLVQDALNDIEDELEERITKPNYIPEKGIDAPEDSFHFVGITLGTFLIAEKDDILYIIDQHAAHERYLYNQIIEKMGEKQTLLVPYVIETESESEDKYLKEIQPSLIKSGFDVENAGNGKWEFHSVPIRWKGSEKDLKKDILDRRINPNDMINAFAASTACRMAVMDGTVLDTATAADIARKALELPDPHCPHGRPVFTTITRKQLFSLVKRT